MKAAKEYSSPVRKLAAFFERSRDQWKLKYQQTKQTVRRLQGRLRSLERSRDHWKQQARQLQAEVAAQKRAHQASG